MPWPIYIQFMPVQTHTYSCWFNALTLCVFSWTCCFLCTLSKRPILMSHYAICSKVCLECCYCLKRKHLSVIEQRGPPTVHTSGVWMLGVEEAVVEGPPLPPSSPLVLKTEGGRKICLPGFSPSAAMRLASTLRLCAAMHISCVVSFQYIVTSPSMIIFYSASTFFLVYALLFFMCLNLNTCNITSGGSQHVSRLPFTRFILYIFFWCLCMQPVGPPTQWSVWHCRWIWPFCPREQWPSHPASPTPSPRASQQSGTSTCGG